MKVFIGWDPRDHGAYSVAVESLKALSSIDVEVIPLVERTLRQKMLYWRTYHVEQNGQMRDDRDGKPFSTQFSFTRFLVPELMEFRDEWVLFIDADVMFRADIASLVELIDDSKAMMCVPHRQIVKETVKMDGVAQQNYGRKNWSSVMLMNPDRCRGLTRFEVNNLRGDELHAMCWVPDEKIGFLPERWNWLENYSDADMDPAIVHFTRGTPDMIGAVMYSEQWWKWFFKASVVYPLFPENVNAAA